MDLARFIQIFVVQGLIGFFYLFMAIKILSRNRKRLNLHLSLFYLTVGIAVIFNMIYATLRTESIVLLLHFITLYLFFFAQVFIVVFLLILLKSENIIKPTIQIFLIGSFGVILLGLWFIPNGITINESTDWKPVWSWTFLTYSYIVCTAITILPSLYISIRIYLNLENKRLKRKWMCFIFGLAIYYFLYYGTTLSNTLNVQTFRNLWSILSLLTVPTIFLIYYGVGRQL